MFDGEGRNTVGEVDGGVWVTMAVEVDQEGGGENITGARGVYLMSGIGGKVASDAMLK